MQGDENFFGKPAGTVRDAEDAFELEAVARLRQTRENLSSAEIDELHAVPREQKIIRADVAGDDSARVALAHQRGDRVLRLAGTGRRR